MVLECESFDFKTCCQSGQWMELYTHFCYMQNSL